jgi:hyperosmotically inducible periplasmic protein
MTKTITLLFGALTALALVPAAHAAVNGQAQPVISTIAENDQPSSDKDAGDATDEDKAADKTSSAKQNLSDAAITTKVKSKLLADKATHGTSIHVDTKGGVVTLSGAVKSDAEKDAAAQLARDTSGVKDVDNKLKVSGS